LQFVLFGFSGVYVIPSASSSFLWYGVIFVRSGLYKEGIFRFSISLPEDFPLGSQAPTVIFQSEIFHPSICPYTHTLDISEAFPNWQSGHSHLWQLLKFIIYIFDNPQPENNENRKFLNEQALELLTQNKAEFMGKVKENVRKSRDQIYDEPPTSDKHYLQFETFDMDIHQPVLDSIKAKTDVSLSPQNSGAGLSWVDNFQPLGKMDEN
jgi:ubiquitin-protein ligase